MINNRVYKVNSCHYYNYYPTFIKKFNEHVYHQPQQQQWF
jgi:hypothetical protein